MRLIDADAITYCSYDLDNYHWFRAVDEDEIAEAPTITLDDLRPKGRWVDGNCSLCGAYIPTNDEWDFIDEDDCHYCYNCGADMRGGAE